MAIEADFALGGRADRKIWRSEAIGLGASVTPDVGINAGLQPHRMDAVDERTEAGFVGPAGLGARENRCSNLQPPVRLPPLQPPAVVDIDVAIAKFGEP